MLFFYSHHTTKLTKLQDLYCFPSGCIILKPLRKRSHNRPLCGARTKKCIRTHGRQIIQGVIVIENHFLALPQQAQIANTIQELTACNELTSRYGLTLTPEQMLRLSQSRFQALKNTGRVEFGESILKKLVYAFCDSPYLTGSSYERTLCELQEIFYYFKNESLDALSDDELIDAMKSVFDGNAQGSLEHLSGTALENLCRMSRGGEQEEPDRDSYDDEEDYE